MIFDQSSKLVISELLNYNYFTADENERALGCTAWQGPDRCCGEAEINIRRWNREAR